jgi:hypothetical protein
MNSLSEELLLAVAGFLVDPRDFIVLRETNKRMRTTLPVLIGTNLDYFFEYARRLENFKNQVRSRPGGCNWSRIELGSILSWDLSKENCFPYHFFTRSRENESEAVKAASRTCSHDNIDDEDVLYLFDWCLTSPWVTGFQKVLSITKQIVVFKKVRDQLISDTFEKGTDPMINVMISELFDPKSDFPLPRPIWLRAVECNNWLIRELVSTGALNLEERDDSGRTLLLRVIGQDCDLACFLLNKGADVHATDSRGKNALDYLLDHKARGYRSLNNAKIILRKGLKFSTSFEHLNNQPDSPLVRYLKWYTILRA